MTDTDDTAALATDDPKALALMRNDVRGLSKAQIAELVGELADRMGVPRAMAPVDLIADKQSGAIRPYLNARGAAYVAARNGLTDDELTIDIMPESSVVLVRLTMSDPGGRKRQEVGAASYKPDWPDSLANAIKRASTSAHRRASLGLVGIFLSEPANLVEDVEG